MDGSRGQPGPRALPPCWECPKNPTAGHWHLFLSTLMVRLCYQAPVVSSGEGQVSAHTTEIKGKHPVSSQTFPSFGAAHNLQPRMQKPLTSLTKNHKNPNEMNKIPSSRNFRRNSSPALSWRGVIWAVSGRPGPWPLRVDKTTAAVREVVCKMFLLIYVCLDRALS